MTIYLTILAMMLRLSPSDHPELRHGRLATAISEVIASEPPLYADDDSRERTAALIVAISFRESSLRHDAIGDGGRSVCAMQVYGGRKELLSDSHLCIRTGLSMLRESIRVDRTHPVAFYARGPRWRGETAQRISNDRVALAASLLR